MLATMTEPLIIINTPRSQRDRCGGCHQVELKPMKICSTCKQIKYCSKECQKGDWKRHKTDCEIATRHEIEILEADKAIKFSPHFNIDSYTSTFEDIDQSLRRWMKFYDFLLMAATVHALDLPRDSSRSRTHALWVTLRHRDTMAESPGKYFRIANASVVTIVDLISLGRDQEWKDILGLLSGMRDRSKAAGAGEIGLVVIECPPLGLQILPIGSLMENYTTGKHAFTDWKEKLIECVEQGERTLQFGS